MAIGTEPPPHRGFVWSERYHELPLTPWRWQRINVSATRPELVFGYFRPALLGRVCQASAELRPGEMLALGRHSLRSAVMLRYEPDRDVWVEIDAGVRLPRWGRATPLHPSPSR